MASLHSCPCCGGTDIEEDSTHGVVVCTSCGAAVDEVPGDPHDSYQQTSTKIWRPRHEPSIEQIRTFSNKSYSARKEELVVRETKKMAARMRLPSSRTTICVDQAKELCRRQVVGMRGLSTEVVTATLVYVAWKNENNCVSAWDMMNTGVKPNVLLKATRSLCSKHPDLVSVSEAMPITERERLNLRLDRFSPICGEERHSVIAMAQEVWGLIVGVKVKDVHLNKIPANDYAVLAVALQYVKRKDLPKSEVSLLAENISMKVATVKTRIWVIKKALLTLATRCPSLEQDVKNKVITVRNVQRYLDRLLQNKEFLVSEMKRVKEEVDEEADEQTITGAGEDKGASSGGTRKRGCSRKRAREAQPVVLVNEPVDEAGGGEGEDNLSDLDDEIDEYILNEEQVKMRKYLLSPHLENSDSD